MCVYHRANKKYIECNQHKAFPLGDCFGQTNDSKENRDNKHERDTKVHRRFWNCQIAKQPRNGHDSIGIEDI